MRSLYLAYVRHRDRATGDVVLVGRDRTGKDFGVGSGPTTDVAVERLRDWVVDSLLADAGDGQDHTSDLELNDPGRPSIELTPLDLVPIRLRLLRARRGMTQLEMASRLGMTQQGYARLERPGANLQLRTIVLVEAALELELLQLAYTSS